MHIKEAKDESELIHVISGSLSHVWKKRNYFEEEAYLMNMIVLLQAIRTNDLSTESVENIRLATAILRKLQR